MHASASDGFASERQDGHPFFGWFHNLRSPLGRRIVFVTVICSTVITVLLSAIQLYGSYRSDLYLLDSSVQKIERSIVPSLAESLWIIDDVLIQRQLEGLIQIEGIEHVRITDSDVSSAFAGNSDATDTHPHVIPLVRSSGGQTTHLGSLRVQVSYAYAYNRLVERGALILVINAIKTFLIAVCILVIHYYLVGRHLIALAEFASQHDPNEPPKTLELKHAGLLERQDRDDELSRLTQVMIRWIASNYSYFQLLRDSNAILRENMDSLDVRNRQLHEANREQAEFTYAISHDLKSPINTMGMLLDELSEFGGMGEDGHDVLSEVKQTNQRMRKLVDDVLRYSQVVEERRKIERINLDHLISEILRDLAAEIRAAGAVIERCPLPVVYGHPMQFRALYQNLIANAVKFRSPDSPCRVRISSTGADGLVSITVADNGIGIPPDKHDTVFGLFQRLHARSVFEGSGLGLSICKRITANHQGEIIIGPGIDGGAAFTTVFRAQPVGEQDQTGLADR